MFKCAVSTIEGYKAYAQGEYAPFSHRFALVKRWIDAAEKMTETINEKFEKIEKHLLDMLPLAAKGKFRSEGSGDWMLYKTIVDLLQSEIESFVGFVDKSARPEFEKLKEMYENRYRDNQSHEYKQACQATRLAWAKLFVVGEAIGSMVTGGMWQSGFFSGKYCVAAAAIGSLTFAGWTIIRYREDVDLSKGLDNLECKLRYLETYVYQYKERMPKTERSLADLIAYLKHSVEVTDNKL